LPPEEGSAVNVDFLGTGWNPDNLRAELATAKPEIVMSAGEKNIQQAIWIILATAPGERVMRPNFGCGVHHLVFEVNSSATIARVVEEVRHALILWEPRIEVLGVDAEIRHLGELLLINIHYRVRSTNNYFNLVYPFYTMGRTH
jgi:phage baseplate assembly protein W